VEKVNSPISVDHVPRGFVELKSPVKKARKKRKFGSYSLQSLKKSVSKHEVLMDAAYKNGEFEKVVALKEKIEERKIAIKERY